MLFQQLAPMKSSQSALEPLELEPLELRLLPELELSLPTTPGDVVSAAAERSARAMKRSLLMASMEVHQASAGPCSMLWVRDLMRVQYSPNPFPAACAWGHTGFCACS